MAKRKFNKTRSCGNKVKKRKPNEEEADAAAGLQESASKFTTFFRKAALVKAQVFSDQELDLMLSLNRKSQNKRAINYTLLLNIANKMMTLPNLNSYISEIAGLLNWSIVLDERIAQVVLNGCSKLSMSSLQNIGATFSTRKTFCRRLILATLQTVNENYRWVVALASKHWTSYIVAPTLLSWYSAAEESVKEPFRRLVLPYFCAISGNERRTATAVMRQLMETWILQFRSDRSAIFTNFKANLAKNPKANYARLLEWHNWFATGVVTLELLKRVNCRLDFLCQHDFQLLLEICYCANDVELLEEFVFTPFRKSLFKYIKTPRACESICFILQPTSWDYYYFPHMHNQETRHSILVLLGQNLTDRFLPFVRESVSVMLSCKWKVALVSKILKRSTGHCEIIKATMFAVAREIMQNHLPLLPTSSVYHLLAENIDADAFLYAVNVEDKNHVYFSVCLLDALGGEGLKKLLTNDSSFEILGQLFQTEIPGVLERLENNRPVLEEILGESNTSHKENLLYLLNDKYRERYNRHV